MGYYSRYRITAEQIEKSVPEFTCGHFEVTEERKAWMCCPTCGKKRAEKIEDVDWEEVFEDFGEQLGVRGSICVQTSQWDTHEKDMLSISAQYPQVLFEVNREGEENEDISREWFLNGKTLSAGPPQIIYPEMTPEKLEKFVKGD